MDHTRPMNTKDDCGDGESAEVKAVYAEIGRTRQSLDDSLNELQERLSPTYIAHQTRVALQRRGNDMYQSTIKAVKANPVPAVLIGAGIAWIISGKMRDKAHGASMSSACAWPEQGEHHAPITQRAGEAVRSAGHTISHAAHAVGGGVSHAAHAAGEAIGTAAHSVKETVSHAAGTVSEEARHLAHRADEARRAAQERVKRGYASTVRAAEHSFEEYPLLVGLSAFAAGVAIAGLIPSTRRESQLMGSARNQLFTSISDRARRVTRTAVDTVSAAAHRESLADPSRLLDEVRENGGSAAEIGQEIGRRAGAVVGEAIDSVSAELKPGGQRST